VKRLKERRVGKREQEGTKDSKFKEFVFEKR
jgi:hypothetical protein